MSLVHSAKSYRRFHLTGPLIVVTITPFATSLTTVMVEAVITVDCGLTKYKILVEKFFKSQFNHENLQNCSVVKISNYTLLYSAGYCLQHPHSWMLLLFSDRFEQ